MGHKLSEARSTVDFTLSGGCIVTVYTALTVSDQRALETQFGCALKDVPQEKQPELLIAGCSKIIKTWDMVDDDDKAVLPTEEVLSKIPIPDLQNMMAAVKKVSGETTQS